MLTFDPARLTWTVDDESARATVRLSVDALASLSATAEGRYSVTLWTGEYTTVFDGDDAEPTLEYAIESAEGALMLLVQEWNEREVAHAVAV